MNFNKKSIASIVVVAVATAYSLMRWRGDSEDSSEQSKDPSAQPRATEHQTPADD